MWGRRAKIVACGGVALTWIASVPFARAATPVFGPATPVNAGAVSDAGNDGSPRIVTDGHGTWMTVWASTNDRSGSVGTDSDVLSAHSNDLGISWSLPVPVNATAASDTEFDFAPALATDGQGLWVAVWVATNGLDTDIFVARSTTAGATWSAPVPLYADADSISGNADRPQIVSDGGGTWIVVWDATGRFGNDRDVLATRSVDGGVTWSAPTPVTSNAASDRGGDQRAHLATDGVGTWLVAWASNDTLGGTIGNDFDVLLARSSNGGASWTGPLLLNTNAGSDHGLDDRPQLASDGHGTWVATWVSDDALGGTLGSDLDVLTSRSTDGGLTWSAPSPLNANAATDTDEDAASVVVTDRRGTWVALWESNTLSGAHEILMAHSLDGGAHWAAPHILNPEAAGDGRRDMAPQLATDGSGVWNAVWTGLGGTLGSDSDLLRAGGRERCGNGSLDFGEQCDDGNTIDGDSCPASCEFPPPPTPSATPTPKPTTDGVTPSTGTGAAATPSAVGNGFATPSGSAGATPLSTATPTAAGTGEATPTRTASPDPNATTTPVPSDGVPPATPTPRGGPAATGSGGGSIPTPGTTSFGGGLASTATAKAAVACQRAVIKGGAQLLQARLSNLGNCSRAVQRCVLTQPDDGGCLQKAAGRCQSALGGLAAIDRKTAAAIRKRCGDRLALSDVLGSAGLGHAALACGEDEPIESLEALVDCVVREHACRGATLFEVLQPRAKELMRLPGMNAATLDTVGCLPDHGGDGAGGDDPGGQGKVIETCSTAIVKAGTTFVRKGLARRARCLDGLFSCVQLAPNDEACLAKARSRCDQGDAATGTEERALTSAVAARCGEHVIAYATLRAARAANFDALTEACAAVGVPELESLADYQQCLLRIDTCRVEGILLVEGPRAPELLSLVGRVFDSPYCGRR